MLWHNIDFGAAFNSKKLKGGKKWKFVNVNEKKKKIFFWFNKNNAGVRSRVDKRYSNFIYFHSFFLAENRYFFSFGKEKCKKKIFTIMIYPNTDLLSSETFKFLHWTVIKEFCLCI